MIPVLESERLILRAWRESDFEQFAAIYASEADARENAPLIRVAERLGATFESLSHSAVRIASSIAIPPHETCLRPRPKTPERK